jgi:N-acetyl sugar amidotransferase
MKNNFSLYGLPETVKFCKLCVISNQRPSSTVEFKSLDGKNKTGISLNENQICSACLYSKKKSQIDWAKRERQFFSFLEKYRKYNGEYDCIVPSSGGKDSSFTAHILKTKYKMNPLAVTWAPTMWTDIGFENFNNLSRIGGIDSLLITPNGKLHQYLTKIAFLNLGHPFQPFIHGQKIIAPKIAKKFNVPLIIYGENQAEYGNKLEDNLSYYMDNEFFSVEDQFNFEDIKFGGRSIRQIIKEKKFNFNDFSNYIPLRKKEVLEAQIQMIYLGYFEKWDPQECFYYASENTGFKPAKERSDGTYSKYTEIDDKLVPFHFYTTFIKFGIGRASYDASQEIRNKKITRDEAVNLVKKFDGEFPKTYFKDFLDYIEISENKFFEKIDELRSPHLWEKINGEWKLKQIIT